MSLEEESSKLDPENVDEILMYLMISTVVETRAMLKFIFENIVNNDPDLIEKYQQELKERGDKEYRILKDQLYGKFGPLPPGLFE